MGDGKEAQATNQNRQSDTKHAGIREKCPGGSGVLKCTSCDSLASSIFPVVSWFVARPQVQCDSCWLDILEVWQVLNFMAPEL